MAEKIDPQVADAVTATNLKNLGEFPTLLAAQMLQHGMEHANRVNALAENAIMLGQAQIGAAIKNLLEVDPVEAQSVKQMHTGDAISEKLANLTAAIAAGQQNVKGAQTTPPDTGGAGSSELAALTQAVVAMQQTLTQLVAKKD